MSGLISLERRRRQSWSFAWRLRSCAFRRVINAGTVTLLHDCFRNPVCQRFAIFGVARLAALQSIAQKTALNQHRRVIGQSQDAEIGRVNAAIGRMRNGHQLRLDPIGQVV